MHARFPFVVSVRKGLTAVVAVVSLTALSLVGSATIAQADPTGTISGTVTGHGGFTFNSATFGDGAYAEAMVFADDNSTKILSDTFADASGKWTSAPLAYGEYKVMFKANTPGDGPTFLTQWWTQTGPTSDFSAAGIVTISSTASPTGIDDVMNAKPAASGLVVDQKGRPIGDVNVTLFKDGEAVNGTTTDDSGSYYISNADEGSDYTIEYEYDGATVVTGWYGGADQGSATNLTLSVNTVDELSNVILPIKTSIAGTVTDADGNGLPGVTVIAAGNSGSFTQSTDSDGKYLFPALPADDWTLTYSLDGFNTQTRTADTSSNRAITGLDETLTSGGTISGTVTGPKGAALSTSEIVDVNAIDGNGNIVASTSTQLAGHYELDSVPFGTYSIQFVPEDSNNPSHYSQVTSSTQVSLSDGHATVTVNQSLSVGGTITGSVTTLKDSTKHAENITVTATSGSYSKSVTLSSFSSSLKATYTLSGLPAGTYTVEFAPDDPNVFVAQWYGGHYSAGSAASIKVALGKTVKSINNTLVKRLTPADKSIKAKSTTAVTVGETLSIVTTPGSVSTPSKVSLKYQWFRKATTSGAKATSISKATKSTYKPTNSDAGYLIGVTITTSASGYATENTTLTDQNPVSGAKFSHVPSSLSLSGTAATGHTLTAKFSSAYSPTPTSYTYAWTLNGVQLPSAWSTTPGQLFLGWDDLGHGNPYTTSDTPPSAWLTAAGDAHISQVDPSTDPNGLGPLLAPQFSGGKLAVTVCAQHGEFYIESCKTASVTVAKDLALRDVPTVSQTGNVLTVDPGVWHSTSTTSGTVTFAYQWYRAGKAISKATKSTYTVSSADEAANTEFYVSVTGSAKGYTSYTINSRAHAAQ